MESKEEVKKILDNHLKPQADYEIDSITQQIDDYYNAVCQKRIEEIFEDEFTIDWDSCPYLKSMLHVDDISEIDEIIKIKWQARLKEWGLND